MNISKRTRHRECKYATNIGKLLEFRDIVYPEPFAEGNLRISRAQLPASSMKSQVCIVFDISDLTY